MADALYMEKEITTRIEKALKTVKNLDTITSQSTTSSIEEAKEAGADIAGSTEI